MEVSKKTKVEIVSDSSINTVIKLNGQEIDNVSHISFELDAQNKLAQVYLILLADVVVVDGQAKVRIDGVDSFDGEYSVNLVKSTIFQDVTKKD